MNVGQLPARSSALSGTHGGANVSFSPAIAPVQIRMSATEVGEKRQNPIIFVRTLCVIAQLAWLASCDERTSGFFPCMTDICDTSSLPAGVWSLTQELKEKGSPTEKRKKKKKKKRMRALHPPSVSSNSSPQPEIPAWTISSPQRMLTLSGTPPFNFHHDCSRHQIHQRQYCGYICKKVQIELPKEAGEGGETMAVRRATRAQEQKEKREEEFCLVENVLRP